MDLTTTLITFMFQTSPSAISVDLVGSWDNFVKRYPMERDSRRGAGEWRGLHSFKDITCDGDGAKGLKRDGALKMGHDYYYYYELNDGTEIHNKALPSTTTCPYLPGQPVNVLNVPVQINPLRERSASEGAVTPGLMTLNPADKFMAPRAPPPTPKPRLARLNTSPAVMDRQDSARSASDNGPRSPWSARSFFGLKSAMSALPNGQDRGRLASPVARDYKEANTLKPSTVPSKALHVTASSTDPKPLKNTLVSVVMPGTMSSQDRSLSARKQFSRDPSPLRHPGAMPQQDPPPHPVRKQLARDPSPLRHATISENSLNPTALTIPDEIAEEDLEDDANFATPADARQSLITRLSPPPQKSHHLYPPSTDLKPHHIRTSSTEIKPLPKLPNEYSPVPVAQSPSLIPAPLNLGPPNALVPRSHFSVDTIATELLLSPTESHYSSASSTDDSNDEDGDAVTDDSFTFNSASTDISPPNILANRFQYSLPEDESGSQSTLKKGNVAATGLAIQGLSGKVALRQTFGPQTFEPPEKTEDAASALDQLLSEMGFLGEIIDAKEV